MEGFEMNGYVLTEEKLAAFEAYLRKDEHEKATIGYRSEGDAAGGGWRAGGR